MSFLHPMDDATGFADDPEAMPFRWVNQRGDTISGHGDLAEAGRAHRRHFRTDIRCIDASGADVTDAAITASIEWR